MNLHLSDPEPFGSFISELDTANKNLCTVPSVMASAQSKYSDYMTKMKPQPLGWPFFEGGTFASNFHNHYNAEPATLSSKDSELGPLFSLMYNNITQALFDLNQMEMYCNRQPIYVPAQFLEWWMQNQQDYNSVLEAMRNYFPFDPDHGGNCPSSQAGDLGYYYLYTITSTWGTGTSIAGKPFCTWFNEIVQAGGVTPSAEPCTKCQS